MPMIPNKVRIIKKQLKSHYHYTVNTSFILGGLGPGDTICHVERE